MPKIIHIGIIFSFITSVHKFSISLIAIISKGQLDSALFSILLRINLILPELLQSFCIGSKVGTSAIFDKWVIKLSLFDLLGLSMAFNPLEPLNMIILSIFIFCSNCIRLY